MIELNGKYNIAKVFTDVVEESAISQIIELCNQEIYQNSKIRIMPDVHSGSGCTIGTTMTVKDKICVNLVGIDIGCGMETIKLNTKHIDLDKLDKVIRKVIPSGQNVRESYHSNNKDINYNDLKCIKHMNLDRAKKSLGTLGGGNHFIEVNKDKEGYLYLVIHSGSRYLGKQVAEYYYNKAIEKLSDNGILKNKLIEKLKSEHREKDIQRELSKIKPRKINKQLAYVEGELFKDYINDMNIIQKYADLNRKTMALEILTNMNISSLECFTTIHNYIDMESMILRKGSIDATLNKKVLIPLNMRDGSILAIGKGNEDWNYSAPHGAGRILSRSKAKERINLEEFRESMKGIYSTSVCESTIDESPMAYKNKEDIINNIGDTVEILDIVKPIYNFKANN